MGLAVKEQAIGCGASIGKIMNLAQALRRVRSRRSFDQEVVKKVFDHPFDEVYQFAADMAARVRLYRRP